MRVTLWGTRGSLPTPLSGAAVRRKIVEALVKAEGRKFDTVDAAEEFCTETLSFAKSSTYGGNSSCVQVDTGSAEYLLCDLGSGVRPFSLSALGRHGPGKPQTYNVLLSHVHWDHIMGFPFFVPSFIPGNKIRILSCHPMAEQAIRGQGTAPCFPVEFASLGASIEFVTLEPGRSYPIAGATVTGKPQLHGNNSYGYRIEKDGKTVVYTTDCEHKMSNPAEVADFVTLLKDADLVIFDAMYSLANSMSIKEDWGHSSNVVGVELCQMAGAKQLCLFHHEPIFDDAQIDAIFAETIRFEEITRRGAPLRISAAYDGMVIEV